MGNLYKIFFLFFRFVFHFERRKRKLCEVGSLTLTIYCWNHCFLFHKSIHDLITLLQTEDFFFRIIIKMYGSSRGGYGDSICAHSICTHSRRTASILPKGTRAVAGFEILDFSRWSQHRESGRNIKSNLTREIQYRIIRKKSKIQLLMHGNTFCAPYYGPFYIYAYIAHCPLSPLTIARKYS